MIEAYQRWLNHPLIDADLLSELQSLTDEKEIEDRFYQPLSFGTAGLRGVIGAGTNRMNKYTVRRATEGFAHYLLTHYPHARQQGVVIAFDSRHYSPEFAQYAAGVLAHHGIRVYLFKELRPTPILSFTVRHLQAVGGIMITASHNPPEYNGYKVYDPDGAQLLPKPSKQVLEEIEKVEDELSIPFLTIEEGIEKGIIQWIGEEIDHAYMKELESLVIHPNTVQEMGKHMQIVFTPLHGTGNQPVRHILNRIGFPHVHVVPEQEQPDPHFSTVTSPNPEERKVFDLALQLAQRVDADLVVGTDPDADRLGVIVKHQGEYIALTGNQIGALLLYYVLEQKQAKGILPANGAIIKTIVTSELGAKIATFYGVQTFSLLTGFKYIAEKMREFEDTQSHTFLMGYEESYGYLFGDFVRDKDAVQATMIACEMAAFYKKQGRSLIDVLEQLFNQFGTHVEDLVSFTFKGIEGQAKIQQLMDQLRHSPLQKINDVPVTAFDDYQQGLFNLPSANVLKIHLADHCWIATRPSGTEPKIKFYFGAVGQSKKEAEQKLQQMKEYVLQLVRD